jgi:hypothetical protein
MSGLYPPPGCEIRIIEHDADGQPVEGAEPVIGIVVAAGDPVFSEIFLRVRLNGGHAVFWRHAGWLRTGMDGEGRRWRLERPWERGNGKQS